MPCIWPTLKIAYAACCNVNTCTFQGCVPFATIEEGQHLPLSTVYSHCTCTALRHTRRSKCRWWCRSRACNVQQHAQRAQQRWVVGWMCNQPHRADARSQTGPMCAVLVCSHSPTLLLHMSRLFMCRKENLRPSAFRRPQTSIGCAPSSSL